VEGDGERAVGGDAAAGHGGCATDGTHVCHRVRGERCHAEGEVLVHAGDVSNIEGFALAEGFRADGVPHAVGDDVLWRWGREVGR
jgi:hypothetical protein